MYKLRKLHKWLALIVGLQIFLWGISGLYMTVIDLDIIHGDHLVKELPAEVISLDSVNPLSQIALKEFNASDTSHALTDISLKNIAGNPYYQLDAKRQRILIDAQTSLKPKAVSKAEILKQIELIYAGQDELMSVELLDRYPSEIGGRNKGVWRAEFDDLFNSTLYFEVSTGRLISKRSDLWRIFDFFWMLHIMDYQTREDIENKLFRLFAILSLIFTFLAWWLLYLRLKNLTKLSEAIKAKKEAPSTFMLMTRKLHRWLAILISIQLFLWIAGGVTFTFMDMRAVGGNFLYKNSPKEPIKLIIDHKRILESYPNAIKISQYSQLGKTYAKVWMKDNTVILDQSFEVVEPLSKAKLRDIAQSRYAGNGELIAVDKMIFHNDENQGLPLPHWRMTYNDEHNARIYLSGDTGQFLATRTDTWKLFDFFMMVHFMDYWDRGNFNNGLVIFFALVLVFFSLSGILLLSKNFTKNDFLRIINKIFFRKKVLLNTSLTNGKQEQLEVNKYEILFDVLSRINKTPQSKCGGAGECRQCWVKSESTKNNEQTVILSCQYVLTEDVTIKLR
ncbi:MAG: hypothetical protein ACPGJI_05680 [Kangiellaceae bacterium]